MTKYEAVAQAIKTDIENGVYTEGQAIPTEELLTAQYDVSRQTIRKALALLVEDDLIIKRLGGAPEAAESKNRKDSGSCNVHQRLHFSEPAAGCGRSAVREQVHRGSFCDPQPRLQRARYSRRNTEKSR